MEFNLRERTILLTMAGSHAYGTNGPTSDVDVKGVCVPPQHYRDGFVHHFEQVESSHETSGELAVFHDLLRPAERAIVEATKLDGCVFDVRKFMSLAADANPNILDCLFCADEDVLYVTEAGRMLRDARQAFISTKAMYTFRGYAISQLKRIETHRKWLLNPPLVAPTREEFGLPNRTVIPADQLMAAQDAIQKRIDSWEIDFHDLDEAAKIHIREQIAAFLSDFQLHEDKRWAAAARSIGYDENFIALLDRERHYKAAMDNWARYLKWKAERNPARAALEAKHGFDSKHGMHLVRLMTMCREILTTGEVNVRRPDAAFLLSIRDGAWDYDRLMTWAKAQDEELLVLGKVCTVIPRRPNREFLDDLCCRIVALYR